VKRSMDIRWAEVKVGVLLVASLVVLALGIFLIGDKWRFFTPTTRVEVLLPNVQGVFIGTVDRIAFTEPLRSDQVTVVLALDEAAARRLGPDAVVTVKTRGLVGEKYVDITPGSRYGLSPEVPLQGVAPMGLDEAILRAYQSFERLDRLIESFEHSEGSLGRLFTDPALYDNLVGLSAQLQKLLAAMTEGEGTLARIIADPGLYRQTMAFVGRGEAAAAELQALVRSLQAPEGTLGRLARDPALYDESLGMVRQARRSLAELDALLAALRQGEGSAAKLIGDGELHQKLTRTLEDLDALVRDMKENPGRYVNFSLF